MSLSKTTINYASKRGIDLVLDNNKDGTATLSFYLDDTGEADLIYTRQRVGSFIYKANINLASHIKEELPYFILNEKGLRQMINFISKEIK